MLKSFRAHRRSSDRVCQSLECAVLCTSDTARNKTPSDRVGAMSINARPSQSVDAFVESEVRDPLLVPACTSLHTKGQDEHISTQQ